MAEAQKQLVRVSANDPTEQSESLKFQDALRALDEQEEKERLEAEKRQRVLSHGADIARKWLCAKSCTSLEIKTCHELEPTSEGPQKSTRQRGWFCAGISVQDRFLLDEHPFCTRVETMQDAGHIRSRKTGKAERTSARAKICCLFLVSRQRTDPFQSFGWTAQNQ